jgi:hypothetical protein
VVGNAGKLVVNLLLSNANTKQVAVDISHGVQVRVTTPEKPFWVILHWAQDTLPRRQALHIC